MRLMHIFVLLTFTILTACGGGGGGSTGSNPYVVPSSLGLSADYSTLAVGTATATSTIGHYSGSADQDLTADVTLSSSDDKVVTPVFGGSFLLAQGQGTAVVTATWTDGKGATVTGNLTVTVSDATVTSITLSPDAPTISEGQTQGFTATAEFSDFSEQVLIHDLTWSSDTPAVATVNDSGLASGVGAGDATISATFDGMSGSTDLTVAPVLTGIELTSDPTHISQGQTAQFTVTGLYSDGSRGVEGDLTEQSVFALEDGPITAVISNQTGSKGLLTGVSADGNLTVTATYGAFTNTYQLVIFTP